MERDFGHNVNEEEFRIGNNTWNNKLSMYNSTTIAYSQSRALRKHGIKKTYHRFFDPG